MGEASRLNINVLLADRNSQVLDRLFRLWGLSDEEVRIVTDSLGDWVDRDGLPRLNGAEREQLVGQDQYSLPENRNFRSVNEMARVRGMDAVARAKPDWKDYFTVYGNGKIDIQDASADVLEAAGPHLHPGRGHHRGAQRRRPAARYRRRCRDQGHELGGRGRRDRWRAGRERPAEFSDEVGTLPGRKFGILGGTRYRITSVLDRKQGTPLVGRRNE